MFSPYVILVLSLSGCHLFGTGDQPTVAALSETIKDMRVRDYETGRVTFSTTAALNSRTLVTRLERLMDAENNAAVSLKKTKPFPDPKARAKALVYGGTP